MRLVLTLGSHFDGIAGFPLAAAGNGIEVVWATEIEPFPIVVSKAHFPHMKHYGSITDVSGAELEPVDIITFGSPCQDLSVAGKRAGLEGERSGLFMEAVRTIREMRDATSGVYPRIAVWENVPGSMSSNNGADFRAVLEEILEAEVPVPRSGKWASAGMVRGNGREIAWRILDAQYWGVPQRRRRIFLICDFTGECAGEILFERQSVSGDSQESGKTGQETAGSAGDGAKTAGRYWDGGDISDTLVPVMLEPAYAFSAGQSDKARSLGFHEEVSPTLRAGASGTNMTPTIMEPKAFAVNQRDEARDLGDKSGALQAQPGMKQQTFVIQKATRGKGQNGLGISGEDVSYTLDCLGNHAVAIQHSIIGRKDEAGAQGPGYRDDGKMFTLDSRGAAHAVAYDPKDLGRRPATFENVSPTIKARCGTGGNNIPITRVGYLVRRLTPTECERLQGFPDGWTDVHDIQLTGRKKCLSSDTARYKALGNSVAIPCVRWIMRRIKEQLEELQDGA